MWSHILHAVLGHWLYWKLVAWYKNDPTWEDGKSFRQYVQYLLGLRTWTTETTAQVWNRRAYYVWSLLVRAAIFPIVVLVRCWEVFLKPRGEVRYVR